MRIVLRNVDEVVIETKCEEIEIKKKDKVE